MGAGGLPDWGVGIGWRPEIAGYIDGLPGLKFVEVVAEAIDEHLPIPAALKALRDRGVAVVPHGTRLSIGGADPIEPDRLRQFVAAAHRLEAPLASEHIAFVRAGGVEAGHLLPLPRTREAVDAVVANTRLVQQELDIPFALEPIAAIFDWPEDELTEGQFISEILERTGALLLLDVANVYANAINRGEPPSGLFDAVPLDRVAYVHVAGGSMHEGVYHDTHTDPVPPEVFDLVEALCDRHRPPALMLERDGHYPPAGQLTVELDGIATASGYPPVTPAGP
ncbi:DUF692 domain-containing protein [Nakamurella silvestris]|nr:DUF692 domain-containing protein [Nakamurella silvestris]